jgi:hypothetical protein
MKSAPDKQSVVIPASVAIVAILCVSAVLLPPEVAKVLVTALTHVLRIR